MNITVERIIRLNSEGSSLKGFADINIEDSIIIKGLKIVEGKNGLFVGMPSELGKDGKWYNRIYIKNEEDKKEIEEKVLSAFNAE